jgi:hypothetical protein
VLHCGVIQENTMSTYEDRMQSLKTERASPETLIEADLPCIESEPKSLVTLLEEMGIVVPDQSKIPFMMEATL